VTRILGIDPGSRVTGFGVIEIQKQKVRYIESGVIRTVSDTFPQRLKQIFAGITDIIQQLQPEQVAIESVFVQKNVASALKLGQARGAALTACANQELNIHEYAPAEVKRTIAGSGRADKQQIQHMIKILLNLSQTPSNDAADALAIALCHSRHYPSVLRTQKMVGSL
jgi:crossover junction endodeoxyribonuclease RuvC